MSKHKYQNGKRVTLITAQSEGGQKIARKDRLTKIERGEILSLQDVKALNRCCRRRGIRTGNLSAQFTEVEGVRFE